MTDEQFEQWWSDLVNELDLRSKARSADTFTTVNDPEMQILRVALKKVLKTTLGPE